MMLQRRSRPPTSLLLAAVTCTLIPFIVEVNGYENILDDEEIGANIDPHPDPNEENYDNMIYVGRMHHEKDNHRIGFDEDNGIKYIYGTGFDLSHKDIEEKDLHHEKYGPDAFHDLPQGKTREEVLKERRHGKVEGGPKPFGYVEEHPLDGGSVPPKVVRVQPFFLDAFPVTNKEFGKFVRSIYYETEAEQFGWSFVLSSFLPKAKMLDEGDADPEAEHWVTVDGAYWRRPEGPSSTYKHRENHPVVHVSHRDAAEYCQWVGKRLPGEREYEAAARAGHWGPNNRTLYSWGEEDTWDVASKFANLWGNGSFPWENKAEDGWRGTSPVKHYPPNAMGFHDMTGNVWEWMRGGKHKTRIVRGASYVDSLDGSFNHAATLGARSTLHGTTTTGNVGFRCARSATQRTEYDWVYHDEERHGKLVIEDEFGKRDMIPEKGWEDQFAIEDDFFDGDEFDGEPVKMRKKKVKRKRTTVSSEL
mmetsp:Transcript_9223/g.13074  ORF Transcript_9223/g.13074 Transcript_9223/m.13074 type:complete len:475 (-) Transcript_9223:190-1614(-)